MTPLQLNVLDFVRERVAVAGLAPSIREIAERVGCSVSKAHQATSALVDAGHLERSAEKTRNLRVPVRFDVRRAPTDALVAELRRRGVEVLERRQSMRRYAKTCAADTCGEPVKLGMLMCRMHWFMLPEDVRRGLRRTSDAGETARFQQLLGTAKDIADGLTPEMRARRA